MLKKWWVILLQGILMFILGLFIFSNPVDVLAGISLWFGIIILVTGVVGVFGWIFAGSGERDTGSLIWSLLSALFGILILSNILVTMKAVTIVFGLWVLMTGISLMANGWSLKSESSMGWFLLIVGILGIVAGLMMVMNMGSGAAGIATILGMTIVLTGIALILLSFAKKAIAGKVKDKIGELKAKIGE
ncbi:MAG TPA: DUF308 domain-containing protein [Ignavibacteria bacterium]|nr:DUF308 domain-containing protein [Ignavibacteria bacterium]